MRDAFAAASRTNSAGAQICHRSRERQATGTLDLPCKRITQQTGPWLHNGQVLPGSGDAGADQFTRQDVAATIGQGHKRVRKFGALALWMVIAKAVSTCDRRLTVG
jgi:hypothetical protein